MQLTVDHLQRFAKMRAHTATHLLHHELEKLFPDTKQAGSLVEEDFLRFDFATSRQLTSDEIKEIEVSINTIITQALPVQKKEMPIEEAKKLGAKSFFEDKYGDNVRVITINDQEGSNAISREFCGGTHIDNTKDIGAFAIISQEAVAQGVKRITAYTGPKVLELLGEKRNTLQHIAMTLDCQEKQLIERVEKTMKDYKDLQHKYEHLETLCGIGALEAKILFSSSHKLFQQDNINIISIDAEEKLLCSMDFKKIIELAQKIWKDKNMLIRKHDGQYALICSENSCNAKDIAKELGLKGGGTEKLVQGRDEAVRGLIG